MKNTIPFLITYLLINIVNSSIAQTSGAYRSKQTGVWNVATSWQTYNGSIWIDAASSPSFANGIITIRAGHTITSSVAVTVDQVVIESTANLNITNANFTVNDSTGDDVICNGNINLSFGTLDGFGFVKLVSGAGFNWTGGTNGGYGALEIGVGATLNMSGSQHILQDNKTLYNYGTWNWTGGVLYYFAISPTIYNYGTLNINTTNDVVQGSANAGTFNNKPGGIINKIGPATDDTFFSGFALFTNEGTIHVMSGKLWLFAKSAHSGTINVDAGANINFSPDTANLNTGTIFTGAGNINFDGAPININVPVSTSTNIINLSTGKLGGASTLTMKAGSTFNWTSGYNSGNGTLQIDSGATFNMNGGQHNLQDNKTINNYGTWNWTGGQLVFFATSPSVNNYGSFNILTDFDVSQGTTNSGTFNNRAGGVIYKTGSPSDETFFSGFANFINDGKIIINPGNLAINVPGSHSGSYEIAFGSQLRGIANLTFSGASFINDGVVTLPNLIFSGLSAQTLEGSGSINTLIINSDHDVTLIGKQTINNSLSLTKGKVLIGDNNLVMKASSVINGGSDISYIFTNGSGSLQRRVSNNNTNILFPIGHIGGYHPVSISLLAQSTSDDFKARVIPNIYSAYNGGNKPMGNSITGNAVKNSWIVSETTKGGSNATITLTWNGADESAGFIRKGSRFGYYSFFGWILDTAKAAAGSNPYTLSANSITSFGPFGVINQFVTCLNAYTALCIGQSISVPYKAVGSFNAGNKFTAQLSNASGSFASPVNIGSITSTVSGNINAIIPASATVGAGYRIRVKSTNPATTGPDNGSNITINNCAGIIANSGNDSKMVNAVEGAILKKSKLTVYPNPNNGQFLVHLKLEKAIKDDIDIQIITTTGKIIYHDRAYVSGNEISKSVFLNSSNASGIYILKLLVNGELFQDKIIYQKNK